MNLTPGDCLLTGLCGIREAAALLPSGVPFLAVGILLYASRGWWFKRLGTRKDG